MTEANTPAEAPKSVEAAPPVSTTTVQSVSDLAIKEVAEAEKDYADAAPAVKAVEDVTSPVLGGEPALVIGTIVAIIIAALALTHAVDVSTSVGVVTSFAPLIGGIVTRFFVSPARKPL